MEKLTKPSVKAAEPAEEADLIVIDGPDRQPAYNWMSSIRAYLDNQPLSDDNAEIERVTHKSRMYHLIDGVLYRQGANGIMMGCISKEEDIQLLQDIHSRVCGHTHHGTLSLEKHSCTNSIGRQPRTTR
jgi:hypothetical protein